MYKFFVGVDVSKKTIDVSWTDGPNPSYLNHFANTIAGFVKMTNALSKQTFIEKSDWFICFENTGTYSKALFCWLLSQGIPCLEENAMKIHFRRGISRGKNDKIDAGIICDYAFTNRDRLIPSTLAKPEITELKKLLSQRELMIKNKKAIAISLKEQKAEFSPKLFEQLDQQNKLLINQFQLNINKIEELIDDIIKSNIDMAKNNKLAQSVIGVGAIISWYMIAYTDNFSTIKSSRKFANYIGIAPHPYQSGISIKRNDKTSKMANQQVKAIVSNGILSAIQHDPQIRSYYYRKIDEGKPAGVVYNNIKNKLVTRVFSTIHRGTPYVKLNNYA